MPGHAAANETASGRVVAIGVVPGAKAEWGELEAGCPWSLSVRVWVGCADT